MICESDFARFRLAYSMRFIRSIILASIVLHVFFSSLYMFTGTFPGFESNIIRIGMVLFTLCMYGVTFTEMFKQYPDYCIAALVFANSLAFLSIGVLAVGTDIISQPFSLMPSALLMLMANYIIPMRFKVAVINGILISIPFACVSIPGGNAGNMITIFMMLSILNLLLSINSFSNEEMLKKLWLYAYKIKDDEMKQGLS